MQIADQVFLETLNAEINRKSIEKARADINALREAIKPRIAALDCDRLDHCFVTFIREAEIALGWKYAKHAASDAARSLLQPEEVNVLRESRLPLIKPLSSQVPPARPPAQPHPSYPGFYAVTCAADETPK